MKLKKCFWFISLALFIYSCNNAGQKNKNTLETNKPMAIEKSDKGITPDTLMHNKKKGRVNSFSCTFKAVVKNNSMAGAGKVSQISELYKINEKIPQLFDIPIDKDTTILCKEGTSIRIEANSFIYENTSKKISGNVKVSVIEYYNLSDMILANLSTMSGNRILETGGMINITASVDDNNCVLKAGKEIEIGFPMKEKKSDMQLFSGKWLNKDQIDWQLLKQLPDTTKIFSLVEEMPEFPMGDANRIKFILENINYPQLAKERGVQGTVYVNFTVSENGNIQDIKLLRGIDPVLDQAAMDAVGKMPVWKPGKHLGKNVRVAFNMPISFTLDGNFNTNDKQYAKEFEKNRNDDNLKDASLSEVSRYLFSTSKLGYLNCDRFYYTNAQRINYLVRSDSIGINGSIMLIFDNMNSIYYGNSSKNQFQFLNVPIDEPITIVAIQYKNSVPYLAIKKTRTSEKVVTDLDFMPMTMATLKTEMKKLDKVN